MTAEVAILNRQAVALAADSAVTVSGPSGQKIFNTVNKLFALSKYHPVGIMVYSSAEVMGVPVETVVKSFRNRLGEKSFATLKGYHDEFVHFLTDDTAFFSEETRLKHSLSVASEVLWRAYNNAQNEIVNAYPGWKQPTQTEAQAIANKHLQLCKQYFESGSDVAGVTAAVRTQIKADASGLIKDWRDLFSDPEEFDLSDTETVVIEEIVLSCLLKDKPTGIETGFVVAGFGDDEIFPQLLSFEFEYSFNKINKLFAKEAGSIPDEPSQIIPFAQTEMIETFTEGRARSLDSFLEHFINEFFEEQKAQAAKIPKGQGQAVVNFLSGMNTNLVSQFMTRLAHFTNSNHIEPLMNTVAAMPKEELAAMAEALINLTAIKKHLSPDAETVGGPTDVAVISKGDGFVWIKRKHYFDKEINAQFGYNYNRKNQVP